MAVVRKYLLHRSLYFTAIKSYSICLHLQTHFLLLSLSAHIIGKTLLCKERALRLAQESDRPTYFLSLGAVDDIGGPLPHPLMFDWVTQAEMLDTGVTAMGVHNLTEHNDKQAPSKRAPLTGANYYGGDRFTHVYDLVINFVKENGNSNIIIDECPITRPGQAGKNPYV